MEGAEKLKRLSYYWQRQCTKNQVPEGSVQLKREELGVNAPQLEKKDVEAVARYN